MPSVFALIPGDAFLRGNPRIAGAIAAVRLFGSKPGKQLRVGRLSVDCQPVNRDMLRIAIAEGNDVSRETSVGGIGVDDAST